MALCGLGVSAQGVLNVRINEVLVLNENDIVDDYGVRESWVELFNTGYERVNVGGCYLGIRYADRYDSDGNKLIKKYYILRRVSNRWGTGSFSAKVPIRRELSTPISRSATSLWTW